MALIYLYSPLASGATFSGNKLAITNKAINISHEEKLSEVGAFSFDLPVADGMVDKLSYGQIIGIDNEYFGIVRGLKETAGNLKTVTVSGADLKGYTEQRITLYPSEAVEEGMQGYDGIADVPTETVVKYFINNNIVNPTSSKRIIPGMVLASDLHRGIQDDRYMSRFELLSDLCNKNLENAKLGYKITPDMENNTLVFDVIEGVDRTASQSKNKRIMFDTTRKNLLSLEYYLSIENYKNIFYAGEGSQKDVTKPTYMYYRESDISEPEGTSRYEQYLNISVNMDRDDEYELIKKYALKEAAEYEKAETFTVKEASRYKYGTDYTLGDFITLQARAGLFARQKKQIDVQITSVKHTWGIGGISHELGLGDGKVSIFDTIKRDIRNGVI